MFRLEKRPLNAAKPCVVVQQQRIQPEASTSGTHAYLGCPMWAVQGSQFRCRCVAARRSHPIQQAVQMAASLAAQASRRCRGGCLAAGCTGALWICGAGCADTADKQCRHTVCMQGDLTVKGCCGGVDTAGT
jgi:hypothetical protein